MSGYDVAYYQRPIDENRFRRFGLLRPDQLAAWCYTLSIPFRGAETYPPRPAGDIWSIGCGLGHLERALEATGATVIGVDTSPAARAGYRGRQVTDRYPGGGGTVIWCESLEHVRVEERRAIWSRIPETARIVVTNWLDKWPIREDGSGWDHVATVNDAVFDELAAGRRTVIRDRSHLVLQ